MGGKIREQERARELRSEGYSLGEISSKLNVAKSSVSAWVRDVSLGKLARSRLNAKIVDARTRGHQGRRAQWQEYRKRHPLPEPNIARRNNLRLLRSFFAGWSEDMAYILGLFASDGCMYHSANGGHSTGGWYIAFNSTDLQLMCTVKEVIGIRNKIEADVRGGKRKTKYFIRIVNRDLYKRFLDLGMSPAKSLTLQFPSVPARYSSSFVRGYFDGDGHVSFGKYYRKDRDTVNHVFETGFTSGSHDFLVVLQRRLNREAGLGFGSLHPHGTVWELSYSASDSRQLYEFMYPTSTVPCLQRKRDAFEKALILTNNDPVV